MTGPSHLLLLHGALGASDQFAPLLPLLARHFTVHTLDFEGHGPAPLRNRPFRIQHFAENVIDYLDAHRLNAIDLFGYSLGGYVALYLARTQPDRVSGVFTLGTKLQWSSDLKEACSASNLPFMVDVLDWASTAEYFRRILAPQLAVVHEAQASEIS